MKNIQLTRKAFPDPKDNGIHKLRFTEKALLRAVIVAGQRPRPGQKNRAARADADMRRGAVVSALDMSGQNLKATPEFIDAGRTDKGLKSQFVGHALCAHSAYVELKIPWLADIENVSLMASYNPKYKNPELNIRPDFIGEDAFNSRWYVFECKGRSAKPSAFELQEWKQQAESISRVRGQKVETNIVSTAHLNKAKEWEVLWVDPDHEGVNFEFDEIDFFNAYYEPIRDLLSREPLVVVERSEGVLYYISTLDAYVGIHKNILSALEHKRVDAIKSFSRERITSPIEDVEVSPVSVFADGILVALSKDLDNEKTHPSKDPHDKKPRSRFSEIEL